MSTRPEAVGALQTIGCRDNQEDDFGVYWGGDIYADGNEHILLAVADGMGGHEGGEIASHAATVAFLDTYRATDAPIVDRLRESLVKANEAVAEAGKDNIRLADMGCTLLAVAIAGSKLHWISVGDSLLFVVRNGTVKRLNADHSMAPVIDDMVATGKITAEEGRAHGSRNMLRSVVSGDEISLIDVSSQPFEIEDSDLVIAASDGIETISDEMIGSLVASQTSASSAAQILLDAVEAKDKPNQDNTTILTYLVGTQAEASTDQESATVMISQPRRPQAKAGQVETSTPSGFMASQNMKLWLLGGAAAVLLILAAAVLIWPCLVSTESCGVEQESADPAQGAGEQSVTPEGEEAGIELRLDQGAQQGDGADQADPDGATDSGTDPDSGAESTPDGTAPVDPPTDPEKVE